MIIIQELGISQLLQR